MTHSSPQPVLPEETLSKFNLYVFPFLHEETKQIVVDELTRLEAEKQRVVEEAINFVKQLLYQNGGSLELSSDILFEPESWQIVRRPVIGAFKEIIALEAITPPQEGGEHGN